MTGRGKRARSTVLCWSTLSEGSPSRCFQTGERRPSPPGCRPTRKLKSLAATEGESMPLRQKKGHPKRSRSPTNFICCSTCARSGSELMARKQKLLPQVEVIPSKPVADTAREAPSASASSSSCPVGGSKSFRHMSPYPRATPSGSVAIPPEETPSQISRANRYARYEAVRTLHQQLVSQREIARRFSLSRNTVRKFLQAETAPPPSPRPYRSSLLDAYKPYILERWKAGCWNGMQLLDEIQQRGYTGSEALLRYFLTQARKQHRAAGTALALELSAAQGSVSASSALPPKPPPKRRISPSRASWLCICQPDKLDEQQRPLVEQLRAAHPDLETAYQLSQDLDDWLLQAKQSGIRELKSFAQGIRRDYAAVKAAFSSHWSNGQVEAQVNCLKLQKRLMFGRANFDLLRLHVLRRA